MIMCYLSIYSYDFSYGSVNQKLKLISDFLLKVKYKNIMNCGIFGSFAEDTSMVHLKGVLYA